MKRCLVVLAFILPGLGLGAQPPSIPTIPFTSVPHPLHLPAGRYLGEVAGVALNSHGHIFVYSRGGAAGTELLEFDRHGDFLREIGRNLYGFYQAHAVRVDSAGNIWCVDEGTNMVIEFNPEGRVRMLLGRKWERVDGPPAQPKPDAPPPVAHVGLFNRPTDVAWDRAGDIFVSDGYNNSRVAKFDKEGHWITSWGRRGTGPGEFHTPHSIAVDAQDHVYVGDRENQRIQVFDKDGRFLRQITGVGSPWAICITPGPHQVLYSSDSVPGRIYKLDLSGRILGVFGKAGRQPGEFGWVHEIACPSENDLWVAELLNWRVQHLILHPAVQGAGR